MQIYEINIEGKTSYFILETSRVIDKNDNITKRFFLFSYSENGLYNLVRISSIGTFMEYMNKKNISVVGPLEGQKYDTVSSLISRVILMDQNISQTVPNMNLLDIDSYFDENKIVRCYQLEKDDYELLKNYREKNK